MESVFVQNRLGSIDDDLKEGFETSMVTLLGTPFGSEWWEKAKVTFYEPFVTHLDDRVVSGDFPSRHPSMLYDANEGGR